MLALTETYVGYAAGLSVSLLWTGTSLFFTAAGKRLGATTTNTVRICVAIVLLGLTHRVLSGAWFPPANGWQVLLLALSGVIGLAIGDQALFTAFVRIGPRLSMLMMTTAPLLAGLFGWLMLGERIGRLGWLGIALTVGGVAWVVCERPQGRPEPRKGYRAKGVLLAIVATVCQAGGYLLSKQGIGHGWLPEEQRITPQAATFVRMLFAGLGMVPIVLLYRQREQKRRLAGILPEREGSVRAGLLFAWAGAMVGPFLGVWMSLEAADRLPLGVAQTLVSLPPVLVLPFVRLVYQERISVRAVVGALIAVTGIAVLFMQAGGGNVSR